tara:strand:+ start:56 stop:409 length:354 start_codon:yes stop_codon:yes gene_type:complete
MNKKDLVANVIEAAAEIGIDRVGLFPSPHGDGYEKIYYGGIFREGESSVDLGYLGTNRDEIVFKINSNGTVFSDSKLEEFLEALDNRKVPHEAYIDGGIFFIEVDESENTKQAPTYF